MSENTLTRTKRLLFLVAIDVKEGGEAADSCGIRDGIHQGIDHMVNAGALTSMDDETTTYVGHLVHEVDSLGNMSLRELSSEAGFAKGDFLFADEGNAETGNADDQEATGSPVKWVVPVCRIGYGHADIEEMACSEAEVSLLAQ